MGMFGAGIGSLMGWFGAKFTGGMPGGMTAFSGKGHSLGGPRPGETTATTAAAEALQLPDPSKAKKRKKTWGGRGRGRPGPGKKAPTDDGGDDS
jgi:hypothetical protein